MGVPAVQTQANRLLGELAELIGASPRFAPAPLLVGRPDMAENLLADPVMADVARQWRELTMALVGIGSLEPSELLQLSGNAVDPPDQQALLAQGAVGDVCHRFFSAEGELVASESTPASSASPPRCTARSRAGSAWPVGCASARRSPRPSREAG